MRKSIFSHLFSAGYLKTPDIVARWRIVGCSYLGSVGAEVGAPAIRQGAWPRSKYLQL